MVLQRTVVTVFTCHDGSLSLSNDCMLIFVIPLLGPEFSELEFVCQLAKHFPNSQNELGSQPSL